MEVRKVPGVYPIFRKSSKDENLHAFADLFAEGFDVEGDVDDGEGVSPCGGVEPVAFDEGSVDVGEDGFYHGDPPLGVQMVG